MNENEINLGTWNVPTSWDELTLKQYQEIERFYEKNDKKEIDIVEFLSILSNHTIDEINNLPVDFLDILLAQISFLQTKPQEKEPTNKITIGDDTYKIHFQNEMKVGEYVATDAVLKNDKHNYAAIMAILCRKDNEPYDAHFENEVLPKRIEMFENAPITDILPLVSFFLQLYVASETPSLLSMKVEEAIDHIQNRIESSTEIGVGKRLYMKWRMRKLRKLLKSINNM